jgi:DNA invertase Pin-like site-specific DNA recombinase
MIATETAEVVTPCPVPSKVQPRHLERLAAVYVRQSTTRQVLENRESTALQYGLRSRAIQWGWPPERVLVIDEDLGCSGASAEGRAGFQRLLVEVSLGHVGLVLGIEMSRLARSCRDWHQLLEVCAVFDTLLADQDGLYDPSNYNDRLLLGLKGTISEAELHVLRQRMYEGRLNKARRGEVFTHAPMGYVRGPSGGLEMDPDEQVRSVVRLLFEKFEELGTVNAVLRYLVANHVSIPIRPFCGEGRGQLQWRRPNSTSLSNLLQHPIYAGAYTWGRRQVDPRAKIPGRRGAGRKMVAAERCQVLLKDRCPAYITWEQYEANRRQMADNGSHAGSRRAPRDGPSMLGGLLECGACGRRMNVQYSGRRNMLRYSCSRNYCSYGADLCQSIRGDVLDRLVERMVLQALGPAALELSLAAAADIEKERRRMEEHWRQKLERAAFESDRAARQYHAAEPENRLVARELEKRWEQALTNHRQVREAYTHFQGERPTPLSQTDREAVRALSQDIPALWHAVTTTPSERQQVVRHLLERVVLTAPPGQEVADVAVHWVGGFVSHHQLLRPVARYRHLRDFDRMAERVAQLRRDGCSSPRIATTLNEEGWRPPRGGPFKEGMIRSVFFRRDRPAEKRPEKPARPALQPGEWWLEDLSQALEIPQPTLYRWARRGWVHGKRLSDDHNRWVLWADQQELNRLERLRKCPKTWHGKPREPELIRPKPKPTGP